MPVWVEGKSRMWGGSVYRPSCKEGGSLECMYQRIGMLWGWFDRSALFTRFFVGFFWFLGRVG